MVKHRPVGKGGTGKSWQSRFRLSAKATLTAMSALSPPAGETRTLTVPDPNSDLLAEPSKTSGRRMFGQMCPGCGPASWVRPHACPKPTATGFGQPLSCELALLVAEIAHMKPVFWLSP